MPKPISREYRIYLAIWRKAINSPNETIKINCSSRNMAISMRQGMYRAMRPFRNGELSDDELRNAAEKFVVYIDNETNTLELRERLNLTALEDMFDEIGIDEEDLELGDERMVKHSLAEFLDETPAIKPIKRITPFYARDE